MAPNKEEQNLKWLPHLCLLMGPKEGGNATLRRHSRGSLEEGTKSEMATPPLHSPGSPAPSAGSKNGSGPPKKGMKSKKWLPHPCLLGGIPPSPSEFSGVR